MQLPTGMRELTELAAPFVFCQQKLKLGGSKKQYEFQVLLVPLEQSITTHIAESVIGLMQHHPDIMK